MTGKPQSVLFLCLVIVLIVMSTIHLSRWFSKGILLTGIVSRSLEKFQPQSPTRVIRLPSLDQPKQTVFLWHLFHTPRARRVIVFFHGASTCLNAYVPELDMLYSTGLDVVGMEYRGIGQNVSPGARATEENIFSDTEQTLKYVRQVLGYSLQNIIVWGYSLGSVPASWIAAKYGGMMLCVIHNGFGHISQGWANFLPTALMPLRYVRQLHCPVLVISANSDKICPPHQSRQLYKECPSRVKFWLQINGDHSTTFDDPQVLQIFTQLVKALACPT